MKDQNKRKNERSFCQVPVENKKGISFASMHVVDICKDGIGLVSNRSLPIDEKIVVELAFRPEEKPILVMGQVKWIRREPENGCYRVGVKFTNDLSNGYQSRLRKFFS